MGMLIAPAAMAAGCAPPLSAPPAASEHCAQPHDADRHAPAKPASCSGICTAVEVAVPRVPARMAPRSVETPIPAGSSLGAIVLESDTPPPRLS